MPVETSRPVAGHVNIIISMTAPCTAGMPFRRKVPVVAPTPLPPDARRCPIPSDCPPDLRAVIVKSRYDIFATTSVWQMHKNKSQIRWLATDRQPGDVLVLP